MRRRRRLNLKLIIPLSVIVLALAYTTWFFLWGQPENEETVCELSSFAQQGWLTTPQDVVLVNDFFVYGENLSFFQQPYRLDTRDEFVGKTLRLTNLCTNEIRDYMIEETVDGQIPMDDLPEGVYAMQVNINLQRLQLASNQPISQIWTTINRQDKTKSIQVYSLPDDEQVVAPILLEVKPITLSTEVFDVVIDPGHYHSDFGSLDLGTIAFGLVEADENYKLAVALKEELEALGLRVLILRDENERVNIYGNGGRLFRTYASQAKYYIELQMVGSTNANTQGTQVIHSSYASSRLGAAIHRSLIENTSLVSTNNRGRGNIQGVLPSALATGMDDQLYDGRYTIRETGGKALGAAQFSEFSSTRNAAFAYMNPRGIHALVIEVIYLTHEPSSQAWLNEYPIYAKEIARGFANYLLLPQP
jgi:N-acetylmuramoyl-L-alanine amidase